MSTTTDMIYNLDSSTKGLEANDDGVTQTLSKARNSPRPYVSELSCAMTEASVESLDLLSPGGTPVHHLFSCFAPSARAFEVDYSAADLSTPSLPSHPVFSIPEELLDNHNLESIAGESSPSNDAQSQSSASEVPLASFSEDVPTVTCISSSTAVEIVLNDLIKDQEERHGVTAINILFAIVCWLCISMVILQSHKIPFEEFHPNSVDVIERMVWNLNECIWSLSEWSASAASTTKETLFQSSLVANSVTAEVFCFVLGSSCIA